MAVTATELKKLQREMEQLQKRVAKLETQKRSTRAGSRKRVTHTMPRRPARTQSLKSNKEIIAFLKSKGIIGEPTEQDKRLAAEWRALSPQEQAEVNQELRNIRLDQTVAELIAEVRS
jgi:hypothetical protein